MFSHSYCAYNSYDITYGCIGTYVNTYESIRLLVYNNTNSKSWYMKGEQNYE